MENQDSILQVGPYALQLPDFWHERGHVREKAGLFGYNAVATPGVSFDFYVLAGLGQDEREWKRLLDAFVGGNKPLRHREETESFQGIVFERHRLEGCAALGPDAVYELFLCEAYGDLLHFGFGFQAPLEQEDSLRLLFLTMVSGAIIERGYALQPESEPSPAEAEASAPASVSEPAPASEPPAVCEATTASDPAPVCEAAPASDSAPACEAAPAADPAPVCETPAAADPAPVRDSIPEPEPTSASTPAQAPVSAPTSRPASDSGIERAWFQASDESAEAPEEACEEPPDPSADPKWALSEPPAPARPKQSWGPTPSSSRGPTPLSSRGPIPSAPRSNIYRPPERPKKPPKKRSWRDFFNKL